MFCECAHHRYVGTFSWPHLRFKPSPQAHMMGIAGSGHQNELVMRVRKHYDFVTTYATHNASVTSESDPTRTMLKSIPVKECGQCSCEYVHLSMSGQQDTCQGA